MRIAVMGTGAVGGYFGARLAAAGHELVFIARGKHLEAMRRSGLHIDGSNANLHIEKAIFTDRPEDGGTADLVLFCVKSYDTETAARALAPVIGDGTLILSLQNGVDNPQRIARLWGAPRTFSGVVYIGAQIAAPGVILHSSDGKIIFGQAGSYGSAAGRIEKTFAGAGINCAVSENIEKVQWSKLLWNTPFCAISALARANMRQILASESLIELARGCMAEVHLAALTRGIELPLHLFEETISFSRSLGDFKPSMLQDLEAGKPLEHEAFNGLVVHLMRQAGKPAPVNQCLYALLEQLDKNIRQEAPRTP